jgi:hypothetical protein
MISNDGVAEEDRDMGSVDALRKGRSKKGPNTVEVTGMAMRFAVMRWLWADISRRLQEESHERSW